jgi:hypothetical protein
MEEDTHQYRICASVYDGSDRNVAHTGSEAERRAWFLFEATRREKDGQIYPGFPHGMLTTHADVINQDLLAFIRS